MFNFYHIRMKMSRQNALGNIYVFLETLDL